MSGQRTTGTETVYVKLLDEGVDVWRPVPATRLPDGSFELSQPEWYDPEDEIWEFPPHSRVKCTAKSFADGQAGLVAVAPAE